MLDDLHQLRLIPRYMVMGWHGAGGNGIHYCVSFDEAIEVANLAAAQEWKRDIQVVCATVYEIVDSGQSLPLYETISNEKAGWLYKYHPRFHNTQSHLNARVLEHKFALHLFDIEGK